MINSILDWSNISKTIFFSFWFSKDKLEIDLMLLNWNNQTITVRLEKIGKKHIFSKDIG